MVAYNILKHDIMIQSFAGSEPSHLGGYFEGVYKSVYKEVHRLYKKHDYLHGFWNLKVQCRIPNGPVPTPAQIRINLIPRIDPISLRYFLILPFMPMPS